MFAEAADPIIADRAEFAEALHRLRRGHVLVRTSPGSNGCVIDGAPIYHSFETLKRYALIAAFDNHQGFPGVEYYKLTPAGRHFADRVWSHWRSRPVLERLAVRLTG